MPRGRPRKNPLPDQPTTEDTNAIPMPQEQHEGTTAMDDPKLVVERPISEPGEDLPAYQRPTLGEELPKEKWQRDSRGLLTNLEYAYNEDGSVNWLAMIPKKYFVINKQATTETDIEKVDDRNKLILLAGFKHLAFVRGYIGEATPNIVAASPNYVAMSTTIEWMPNFETDSYPVTRSGTADAHEGNVSNKTSPNGFRATNFLMTIAENRSFVRAVKNFLNISVLGQDEVSLNEDNPASTTPESNSDLEARNILQKLLDDNKLDFEKFKNGINHYVSKNQLKDLNAEEWDTIDQVPATRLFEITRFMKERFQEKKDAAAKK